MADTGKVTPIYPKLKKIGERKCKAPWRYFPAPKRPYENGEIWTLNEKEFKLYHYICWKTWGFNKASDAISLKQMQDGIAGDGDDWKQAGIGYSQRTLRRTLDSLEKKGWITKVKKSRASVYGLADERLYHPIPGECQATQDGLSVVPESISGDRPRIVS